MTAEMQNSGDMILKLLKTFTARVSSRLRIFAPRESDDVFKFDLTLRFVFLKDKLTI